MLQEHVGPRNKNLGILALSKPAASSVPFTGTMTIVASNTYTHYAFLLCLELALASKQRYILNGPQTTVAPLLVQPPTYQCTKKTDDACVLIKTASKNRIWCDRYHTHGIMSSSLEPTKCPGTT
jgi:hypothetical protein